MSIAQGDQARGYTTFIQTHISYDGLAGYLSPSDRDGWYGPQTKGEVETMQAARGIVDDGIIGPQSWGFMHNDMGYNTEVLWTQLNPFYQWWRWEIRWENDSVYKLWEVRNSSGWIYTEIYSHGTAGPKHKVRKAGT